MYKKRSHRLVNESLECAIENAIEYSVSLTLYQNINLQDRKHLVKSKDLKEAVDNTVKIIRGEGQKDQV